MNSLIYTEWNLASTHISGSSFPASALLSRYYLLYWDAEYFYSELKFTESGVSLDHQGMTYEARLLQGEDWSEFQKSKRVCLSFRAWIDSSSGEYKGVVLVKKAC